MQIFFEGFLVGSVKTLLNIYDAGFCENVNCWNPLFIVAESSILDVWLVSECVSIFRNWA